METMLGGGHWLLALVVVGVGALLQGGVGFGVALVAAPVLALINPRLVPGPMVLAALALTALIAWRDRRGMDLRGAGWALPGQVVGTAVAAWWLAGASPAGFGLAFGFLVLGAVGLSLVGITPLPVPRNLVVGGLLAGCMGTLTSVGGPPLALLFQRATGERLRGTLSARFLLGGSMSLGALWLAGRLGQAEVVAGVQLLPGIIAGFLLSGWANRWLDAGRVRPAVLGVSAMAALGVVIKVLSDGG